MIVKVADRFPAGTQGLIFVVDSSDKARLQEARTELHKIINDREMSDALLLVFANKQDAPGRKCEECVVVSLSLTADKILFYRPERRGSYQCTSALKTEGQAVVCRA